MEKAQFLYNDKSARHMLQVFTQTCTFIISLSFSEGKICVAIDSCFLYIPMYSMPFNSTDITSGLNLKFYTPAQEGMNIATKNVLLTTIASYMYNVY